MKAPFELEFKLCPDTISYLSARIREDIEFWQNQPAHFEPGRNEQTIAALKHSLKSFERLEEIARKWA